MRIAVLSDTHLERVGPRFEDIYAKYLSGADVILHAGDWVCVELVDFLTQKTLHGVSGNMDPPEVRRILPPKKVLELGSRRLGLIHGWGSPKGLEDRIAGEFEAVDAIIYGHSHRPQCHFREGTLFFNPGTATGFSAAGRHTMGFLDLGESIRGDIIEL